MKIRIFNTVFILNKNARILKTVLHMNVLRKIILTLERLKMISQIETDLRERDKLSKERNSMKILLDLIHHQPDDYLIKW